MNAFLGSAECKIAFGNSPRAPHFAFPLISYIRHCIRTCGGVFHLYQPEMSQQSTHSFAKHEFIAAPNMASFYVIDTDPNLPLPAIVASYRLDLTGDEAGLSIVLLGNAATGYQVQLSNGNYFGDVAPENLVHAGRILVQTQSAIDGNTVKQLVAYMNGAKIDKNNLTLTGGGIGISDIVSTDPLDVSLVSASLTKVKSLAGAERNVKGIYVEYVDFTEVNYGGSSTSKIWGIQVILHPQ